MTRKDYEMLAACLKAERDDMAGLTDRGMGTVRRALNSLELRITLELELDNSQFDGKRFADASGFDGTLPSTDTSVGERGVW